MDPAGVGLYIEDASPDALCLAAQRASPGPTRPVLRAVGDSGRCERTATSACFTPGPSHLEAARIKGLVVGINAACGDVAVRFDRRRGVSLRAGVLGMVRWCDIFACRNGCEASGLSTHRWPVPERRSLCLPAADGSSGCMAAHRVKFLPKKCSTEVA